MPATLTSEHRRSEAVGRAQRMAKNSGDRVHIFYRRDAVEIYTERELDCIYGSVYMRESDAVVFPDGSVE